jgi:membrane-associated phospholipid phosphatase
MKDVTSAKAPVSSARIGNPFVTVSSNLRIMRARQARVGGRVKANWVAVLEFTLIVTVIVVCCFALVDRGVALQRVQQPEWLGPFSQFITRFGKADWILYPSGFALIFLTFLNAKSLSKPALFKLYRWNLWLSFVFLGVGFPYLVSTLLKLAIGRPRPNQLAEFGLYDLHPFAFDAVFASFPSGHATIIAAFAVVLSLLLPKFRAVFGVIAVLIGFSRVAVGAHHPSDVIAGLATGAILAFLVAKWFAARGLLFLSDSRMWPELRPALKPFLQSRR